MKKLKKENSEQAAEPYISKGSIYNCYFCKEPLYEAANDMYEGHRMDESDIRPLQGGELKNGDVLKCKKCGKLQHWIPLRKEFWIKKE